MTSPLSRFSSPFYALLRIIAGLMLSMHGTQKLFGWPPAAQGHGPFPITSMPGIAGLLELVLGLLIAIGLLTWIAAFLASGEMAVAYWMVHFKGGFWPIINQGELAVLYCFVFLYIAAAGAGIWSIDNARKRTGP
ncbi:MAG TPA: DoxX family protein [Acidobacteriota bacterium]|nr:DoxX family protein [Acidobacteriota bacterium]